MNGLKFIMQRIGFTATLGKAQLNPRSINAIYDYGPSADILVVIEKKIC
jgi:hypothetical protein